MSSQPCVLHIHFWADIRNSAGSVEKVITAFASHGQRYRHVIACCPGAERSEPVFEHHGVRVHAFRENQLANRVLNKILGLKAFTYGDLVRLINRLRPDVLHFHNRQELVDAVATRLDYRPAIVVHYHRHFAKPVVPAQADRLLFISQRTADDILVKTGSTTPHSVVHNPLSIEVMAHAEYAQTMRSANAVPIILFGGGSNPLKGGKELIEAFKMLPSGRARLVLAGRKVDSLPGATHPDIDIVGEVAAEKFFDLMLASDIVAMPSYDEPFGLIAQEAMLLRKLLVVAGSGGLAEFTGPDCAVIVAPNSVQSLHQGLLEALDRLGQSELLAALLERAQTRVATFFPANVVAQLETAYDQACRARTE